MGIWNSALLAMLCRTTRLRAIGLLILPDFLVTGAPGVNMAPGTQVARRWPAGGTLQWSGLGLAAAGRSVLKEALVAVAWEPWSRIWCHRHLHRNRAARLQKFLPPGRVSEVRGSLPLLLPEEEMMRRAQSAEIMKGPGSQGAQWEEGQLRTLEISGKPTHTHLIGHRT